MCRKLHKNKEAPYGYTIMCRKLHKNKEAPYGYTIMCRKLHKNKERRGNHALYRQNLAAAI